MPPHVLGSAATSQYQMLCYTDGKSPICTTTIAPSNEFRYNVMQGPSYGNLTADDSRYSDGDEKFRGIRRIAPLNRDRASMMINR